jgi:hypothetical protein
VKGRKGKGREGQKEDERMRQEKERVGWSGNQAKRREDEEY